MGKSKYDAFISYRHTEPDKYVATSLHKKLESFKLPKKYIGKCERNKIERVFRDQDELPLSSNLSDSIDEALHNTDFLIVVCSPRLPQSQWCLQEIETFIKLYGRERILAVLCEGEPHESFPEALIKEKIERIGENGETIVEYKDVEPLAADVRGKSKAQMSKAIDDAVLRIAAPMFGLDYDDLKQRHRERKLKRMISFISIVAAVLLVFSLVSMSMALQIKSQSDQIQMQNEEIVKRNEEIEKQNIQIEEQYMEATKKYAVSAAQNAKKLILQGRKKDALYTLLQAMPESSKDTSYPYTAETEKVLLDTLEPYVVNGDYVMANVYEADTTVSNIMLSGNSTYSLVCDEKCAFSVWDNETGEKILNGETCSFTNINNVYSFTDNEDLLYINAQNELIRYSFVDSKETKITKDAYIVRVFPQANKFAVMKEYSIEIYNMKSNMQECILNVSFSGRLNEIYRQSVVTADGTKLILAVRDSENKACIYDLDSLTLVSEKEIKYVIDQIACDDEKVFIMCDDYNLSVRGYSVGLIVALDLKTGKEIWSREIEDSIKGGLVTDGENSMLFTAGYYSAYCFDKNNGDIVDKATTDTKLISLNTYHGKDSIFMYNTEGECVHFPGIYNAFIASDYFYTPPEEKLEQVDVSDDGILVYFTDKNYVVYYKLYRESQYDYFDYSGNVDVLNKAGTKAMALVKDDSENKMLRIQDMETGNYFDIEYDASDYLFVGDGTTEFALEYNDRFDVYDVNDGKVKRSIKVEDFSDLICEHSQDGKYIVFKNLFDKHCIKVISTETGEEETEFVLNDEMEIGDSLYVINKDEILLEHGNKGNIEFYKAGAENSATVKEVHWEFVDDTAITSDKKYYLISYKDNSLEICDIENDLETVLVMYDFEGAVNKATYIEGTGYVFDSASYSIIVNDNFEKVAYVPFNYGYIPDRGFLKKDQNGWYCVKLYSFDELLDMAREQLGDYVPSKRTLKQYNIMVK